MNKDLTLKPRLSEKSYGLSQNPVVYVFDVPNNATKQMIAAAVKSQFEVTVANVNVLKLKGKTKLSYRKGYRPVKGQKNDIKKAYVTLIKGESLPIYASVEKAEADAKLSQEKADKAAKKAEEKK